MDFWQLEPWTQDYKVYNHFKPEFQRRMDIFGQDRMEREMMDLRDFDLYSSVQSKFILNHDRVLKLTRFL